MTAATYLRMSNDDTEGNDRQRATARDRLDELGLGDEIEFTDNQSGFSTIKPRPGFEKLLRAIEAGTVDTVVARSYDRLTRNHEHALRLLKAVQKGKVAVYLTDEDDDDLTTPDGVDAFWKAVEAARVESARQSKRRRSANAVRRTQGKLKVGQRPFGYRWAGTAKKYYLVPDQVEAPLVTEVFRRIADSKSVHGTAQWLNGLGVTGTRGGRWHAGSLGYLLKNPVYVGDVVHNGVVVSEGEWEKLTDRETFDRVQIELAGHRGAGQKGRPAVHLLSNLVFTPDGEQMLVQTANGRHVLRTKAGKGPIRWAKEVTEFVEKAVLHRLSQPDVAELLVSSDTADQIAELSAERRAVIAQLDELEAALIDRTISPVLAGKAEAGLRKELDVVDTRLAGLRSQRSGALTEYVGAGDRAAAIWAASTLADRREVVRALYRITATPRPFRQPDDGYVRLDPASSVAGGV